MSPAPGSWGDLVNERALASPPHVLGLTLGSHVPDVGLGHIGFLLSESGIGRPQPRAHRRRGLKAGREILLGETPTHPSDPQLGLPRGTDPHPKPPGISLYGR